AVVIWLEQRRRTVPLRATIFAGMAAESLAYALVFGAVVGTATQWILQGMSVRLAQGPGIMASLTLQEGIVLSLGAGIYEELVFRVLLVGGIFGVFRSSGLARRRAGIFAAILAALIFSGFHYIGPYGDAWAIPSFMFRFLAGLVFSALFLLRGFGIAAWTHALYDVVLFLARGNLLVE
ncbi:MAG TPA: CPBP family intramembrane glutamic endopeptidase, partial [Longimicrobiaceae bacterium]|nr:CPBP family intramembrane glutamic endopeptidase [Longimicrobiaceae bacterium]